MLPDDPREPRFKYPEELQVEAQALSLSTWPFVAVVLAIGALGVLF